MTDCITMIKYQGLGNDYLVLDPNKTVYNFRARKSHCCASEALDLVQTVFSTDRLKLMERWGFVFLTQMEVKLPSVETVSVFLQNT